MTTETKLPMKYLQGLNWTLLALGTAMFVNLAVVCLIYLTYINEAPRYRAQLGVAFITTLLFLFMAASAAAAAFGHRQKRIWRWPAQILLVISVGAILFYYLPS